MHGLLDQVLCTFSSETRPIHEVEVAKGQWTSPTTRHTVEHKRHSNSENWPISQAILGDAEARPKHLRYPVGASFDETLTPKSVCWHLEQKPIWNPATRWIPIPMVDSQKGNPQGSRLGPVPL